MSGFAGIAEDFILSAVISEKMLRRARPGGDWILAGAAALMAGSGIFLLAYALDKYLETSYAPDRAALPPPC